ncbi:MAG TPA: hypothetical protein PLP19_09920 [bacterium]|nr:hypothetical protein [bacterium]HPN43794.1 hypothetical protein [bacterium]
MHKSSIKIFRTIGALYTPQSSDRENNVNPVIDYSRPLLAIYMVAFLICLVLLILIR